MIGTRVKVVEGKGRTFPLTSIYHLCGSHYVYLGLCFGV